LGMFEEEYSQYWKTIVDTMADGLMVVDSEGVIISVNKALETLTGYNKEELVGHSCAILDCDTCFGARAEGHDKYCALFKEGHVSRRKCVLRKKDGKPLYVHKNAAVLKDRNGQVIGGVETVTDLSEVVSKNKVITRLRRELSDKDGFHGILGKSVAMKQVFDLVSSAAQSEAPVIIYGDSGTGKELVASAIHKLGERKRGPFIKVNCAALSESLLESELFGHVKGAFTGADRTRVGRFEAANGGDIFLDEIGDLPLSTQVKLLRVLQEKEIEKVGDHRPISIDVRILAATNKDLNRLMEEGLFRQDLYYRIGVIPIILPPLQDRREDIPILVESFIKRIQLKTDKPITGMSREALDLLFDHDWPGNVRELINVIEYSFVLCHEGEIMPNHLPARVTGDQHRVTSRRRPAQRPSNDEEKKRILEALEVTSGNQSKAAEILGISRVTLWKRLKTFDIQVDRKVRG
jgi:two-component system response regulator HydG